MKSQERQDSTSTTQRLSSAVSKQDHGLHLFRIPSEEMIKFEQSQQSMEIRRSQVMALDENLARLEYELRKILRRDPTLDERGGQQISTTLIKLHLEQYLSDLQIQERIKLQAIASILQEAMNQNYQESDKIMLNMFSVHRFFLEVIEEMQSIVTSDRQRDYMLDWHPKTGLTFIHAIKHYLNQQPQLFDQLTHNFVRKENPYYEDSDRRTSRAKHKASKQEQKEPAPSKSAYSAKDQLISRGTEIKQEAEDDSFSNDLQDIPTFDEMFKASLNKTYKPQPVREAVKVETESEFKPAFEEQESLMKDESQEVDEDDNGVFYDQAYRKANAIIYGNFTSRGLKRRPKMEDRIYLQLSNCFVKMISNGRDAFFERMYLQLFKIETTDVKL